MSRAFRDTFKQTFCFACHKFDRRESTISFAQVSFTRNRQHHVNPSVTNDNPPLIQNVNHSTTTPLLSESHSNGLLKKKTSYSS